MTQMHSKRIQTCLSQCYRWHQQEICGHVHFGFGKPNRNLRSTSPQYVITRHPALPEYIEREEGSDKTTSTIGLFFWLLCCKLNRQDVADGLRSSAPGTGFFFSVFNCKFFRTRGWFYWKFTCRLVADVIMWWWEMFAVSLFAIICFHIWFYTCVYDFCASYCPHISNLPFIVNLNQLWRQ